MNTVVRILVAMLVSLVSQNTESQNHYSITVIAKDADTNNGKMFLVVYNTEKDFLEKAFQVAKSDISNNRSTFKFDNLPEGVYAVSIFHDENNNGKMDTNFMGIPIEDYGCSNDASGFMGPPKWDDAKFELKANKQIIITL